MAALKFAYADAVPAGSALHLSDYTVTLIGKIMCYAIVALAMDLIWGYTGILSLGHGFFFALGGYAMGMYLMRSIGRDGVYQSELPDFMVFLDWKEFPWYWGLSDSLPWTLLLVVAIPGLVAFVFGFFAFKAQCHKSDGNGVIRSSIVPSLEDAINDFTRRSAAFTH